MAFTTRNDTSYGATLMRIHTLEEVVKAVQAELEALWDELESLEPGGGSGDQDRIYNLTVRGAQVGMIDDEPQGPSVYEDTSMHQFLWGTTSLVHSHLADGAAGMTPLAEQVCDPDAPYASAFWTDGKSTLGLMLGSNADVYEAVATKDLARLLFGNFPSMALSTMLADNINLYGMIKTCESRLSMIESRLDSVESRVSSGGL